MQFKPPKITHHYTDSPFNILKLIIQQPTLSEDIQNLTWVLSSDYKMRFQLRISAINQMTFNDHRLENLVTNLSRFPGRGKKNTAQLLFLVLCNIRGMPKTSRM